MTYFNKYLFLKYFIQTLLTLATIFTIAFAFGYELMPFDILGSIISAALFAHLLLLVKTCK